MKRYLSLVVGVLGVMVAWGQAFAFWSQDRRFEVQVLINGVPAQEFVHEGRMYIMGSVGERYSIRLTNRTGRRVEVVVAVDGLDAIDGRSADYVRKRGYVLGPWQSYEVEGFRLDLNRVAAFRFSRVNDSYAAQKGDARNVGVIGIAFFEERRPVMRPGLVQPDADSVNREMGGRGQERKMAPRSGAEDALKESPSTAPDARSSMARERAVQLDRPGLGTEFGEARESRVAVTRFYRENPDKPSALFVIWYNDREGLAAMGVPVDSCLSDVELRRTANPFPGSPADRRFAEPPPGWCPYRQ